LLLVEIEVSIGSDSVGLRKVRVPGTTRISELTQVLFRSIKERSLNPMGASEFASCRWSLPTSGAVGAFGAAGLKEGGGGVGKKADGQ
ncbi:unnamed protein product, partial [Polarella glacialis]